MLSNHNRIKWLSERDSRVISESIRASDYTRRKEPGEIEYNWLPRFSSAHFFRVREQRRERTRSRRKMRCRKKMSPGYATSLCTTWYAHALSAHSHNNGYIRQACVPNAGLPFLFVYVALCRANGSCESFIALTPLRGEGDLKIFYLQVKFKRVKFSKIFLRTFCS